MESGIVIDTKKFEAIKQALKEDIIKVDEKINNINNIMKTIDGNDDIWKGKTANKVGEKYLLVSKNFPNISFQFSKYIAYLNQVSNSYEQTDNTIKSSIDNNSDNLMV